MRVLLRDVQTGLYYRAGSKWTAEKAKAFDIRQMPRAVTLALEAHLEHAEILLCYDDPSFDLTLPLDRRGQGEEVPGSVDTDRGERLPTGEGK